MNSINLSMEHPLKLIADTGLFKGLANQNMLFHQCVCELVDNSIAQKREDTPFRVDIIFVKKENSLNYHLYIVDNSKGMSFEILMKAMQPGESATDDNRLNEHGFGLKHALATLSKTTGIWKIYTKDLEKGTICSVKSPFTHIMNIEDSDQFPQLPYNINNISTIVYAEVTLKYIQSVQGRGAPAIDLLKLTTRLKEHLGVTYRGYLTQDEANDVEVDGQIFIAIGSEKKKVIPLNIPMEGNKSIPIRVTLNGNNYNLNYTTGLIDENRRDILGFKSYYQGNTLTQGIDIRLGKRVIATKQLLNIFGVKPHNKYNEFVGELVIPDLPRNILKTVNNKTDIDFEDEDWINIFNILKTEHQIPENPRFAEEEELRTQWLRILRNSEPRDSVLSDNHVWFNGVQIDVFRKKYDTGEITIYELKVGKAAAIDLYQLKMYWDGLVKQGESPTTAWLICLSTSDTIEAMVKEINLMKPQEGSNPYIFSIHTLDELNLIGRPPRRRG